jgi:hypothetical protein
MADYCTIGDAAGVGVERFGQFIVQVAADLSAEAGCRLQQHVGICFGVCSCHSYLASKGIAFSNPVVLERLNSPSVPS